MTEKEREPLMTEEQMHSQLTKADEKKENLFSEKKKWDFQISDLLKRAKLLKESRDKRTKEVKVLKEERKEFADVLKEKISIIRKIPFIKKRPKISADVIKKKIEQLERTIETEVLSFEKEKKLTAQIKVLKRQYSELSVEPAPTNRNELNKQIRHLRKKTDKLHANVQETAKSSQVAHEELLEVFSGLDEARKKQQEFLEQFTQAKEEFNRLRTVLEKKTGKKLWSQNKIQHQRKLAQGKKLQAKVESVEKKIKEGKKLTTEDLLAFQAK